MAMDMIMAFAMMVMMMVVVLMVVMIMITMAMDMTMTFAMMVVNTNIVYFYVHNVHEYCHADTPSIPVFLCMWDSRAREKHWVERNWPPRSDLKPGDPNFLHEPLVDRKKIIFPPLHIKPGLMKQFVKALPTQCNCFKYLILAFPGLTVEKNQDLVKNFLGNTPTKNYTKIVQKLLESYKTLGCNMIIKLNFLHSHLANFLENLGDGQGERFHQDLKVMKERTDSRKQRRNLKMEVVLSRDKITEQQVDAIVNCILSDIQLSDCDGSSTRIDIKVERHRNMEIYSTPLHMWSYEGEKILKTLVMSCFKKAEGARHTSIAFATHTMAILQYPPDVVARVFFAAIIKFAEIMPNYLQKVVLVVPPSAKAFIKAFDKERLKHVFESNIQLNSVLDQTPLHFPRKRTYRRIRRSGVSYIVGDLVKQKVDVIVNSTGNRLNLSFGPISEIILEAAGPCIQEECQRNYPTGIGSWGVAVTSGGSINCKQIYHISLVRSEWSSVEQKYKDIINCLLEKADSAGHTSMAFPVLGTGLIQYPSDQVAKSLFETAVAFHGNHLKNILFVVHPKDFANRKAFEKEELNHIQLEEHVLDEVIKRGAACSISLVKGDIANQNVDVIINSTSPKLHSMGGSLARAGGDTLLQEYKTKYPNGIKSGEIAVTGGGGLNCRNVYHITLDQWSPDEKNC
ncbi:protein mono-ADP-ribosyltransferase PARP14-like [Gigantopelta aegis]|uniref:protein mono-ADP-ribosyltransferase PARP14-like n=1 Tax=Gigantopelta aegis TaxID=1735272 RepID=UPI001B88756D|nr:protein mono-ADP-ribosyltransferase PARP14-like [Gigantopelta aegis]